MDENIHFRIPVWYTICLVYNPSLFSLKSYLEFSNRSPAISVSLPSMQILQV